MIHIRGTRPVVYICLFVSFVAGISLHVMNDLFVQIVCPDSLSIWVLSQGGTFCLVYPKTYYCEIVPPACATKRRCPFKGQLFPSWRVEFFFRLSVIYRC